jgi:5'(3')-deoxyribonucleotidase
MGVRRYQDRPRIYVDMDGPQADYEREIIISGIPSKKLKLIKGTYRRLAVVPHARDSILALLELPVDVWTMTKAPDGSTFAASEKQAWQYEHMPELRDRIIITPDKGAVGRPCDYLIDDHPEWANANNFPGTIIKHEAVYQPDGSSNNNWPTIVARLQATFS